SVLEVLLETLSHLDESSHGPFGVGSSGIEQNAVACLSGVDPLTDRARRVSALERDGRYQEVRDRVQEDVGEPEELQRRVLVGLLPGVEACEKLCPSLLH